MDTTSGSPPPLAMHGLGRHRRASGRWRAACLARCGSSEAQAAAPRRPDLRPDQRQPHRLQQGRQHRRAAARSRRRSRGSTRCPRAPAFLLHTGDITHLSKPEEFDLADQVHRRIAPAGLLRPGRARRAGRQRQELLSGALRQGHARAPAGTASTRTACTSSAWSTSSTSRRAAWAASATSSSSGWRTTSPAARQQHADRGVRAHPPLGGLSGMGLGHRGSAQALCYLKRFGSVTVLNGHIHQVMQKVEGNVTFHTAMSTAFPQPAPGERLARADEGAGRPAAAAPRAPATSPSARRPARWRSSTSRWRSRERAPAGPGEGLRQSCSWPSFTTRRRRQLRR